MPKFDVSSSVEIAAELGELRSMIRDFKQWEPWSPWLSAEPGCKIDYAGDGKSYSWDGSIIGSGENELLKEEEEALWLAIRFFKPWKSESNVDFQFEKAGPGKTKVTWNMHGSLPFFMFWMKKMMVAWVGSDYQRGLAKLKDLAETGTVPSKLEFAGLGKGLQSSYVGIKASSTKEAIGDAMSRQFSQLAEVLGEKAGTPLSLYHKFNMVEGSFDYTAAVTVDSIPETLPTGMVSGQIEAPKTFKVIHTGAYRHLSSAWSAGMMHQRAKEFRKSKACDPFELYLSDPEQTVEEALVTELHFPAL